MSSPRIIACAYSEVGHACLRYLLDRGAAVVAVYTHADAPGEGIWFPSVARLAQERGVSVCIDRDLRSADEIARLESLAPDLLFSFYYRHVLPERVLAVPRLGAFNMHGSLLPRYRGRAPVNWAVLHGERETGATLHVMTPAVDAGDIVDAEAVPIGEDDTAGEVQHRVTRAAVHVLARQLDALASGTAPRRAQNHALATTFGRRRPEDGAIDWSRNAADIHNLIRAVSHPYPGAMAVLGGRSTTVWQSRLSAVRVAGARPGQLRLIDARLYAVCGDGALLEIVRAQPDGERELDGAALAPRLITTRDHNPATHACES
ncbi:MAG TPA: formyltransferase [Gemmatimonadaceae bacterium]|nr:formyltransferase [Gemmatimonadaceae bacterium]